MWGEYVACGKCVMNWGACLKKEFLKCRGVGAMTIDQGGRTRVIAWLLWGGLSERPIWNGTSGTQVGQSHLLMLYLQDSQDPMGVMGSDVVAFYSNLDINKVGQHKRISSMILPISWQVFIFLVWNKWIRTWNISISWKKNDKQWEWLINQKVLLYHFYKACVYQPNHILQGMLGSH